MDYDSRAIRAVLLVCVLAVASMGAFAAAPSVDSETTDTTTTSDLTAGDTIQYNATTTSTLSFSADSANGSVAVYQNGTELAVYTNDSDLVEHVSTASGTYYFNATFSDDASDFDGIEAGAGETVDLKLQMRNDSSLDNPDVTNITVSFANDDNITFARLDSGETEIGSAGTLASTLASIPVIGDGNVTDPATASQSIDVNGADQEEIIMEVTDADAQDALSNSVSGLSGVTWTSYATLDGDVIPVVSSSSDAPSWLDTDSEAYVTVADDGTSATVHNAGDAIDSGTTSADLELIGSKDLGTWGIRNVISSYGGGWLTQITTSVMSNLPF